ncbi:hypothetical protein WA158_003031 [Blastocystis sp. Blastoise]
MYSNRLLINSRRLLRSLQFSRSYSVYTFGSGIVGSLGHGDFEDLTKPKKVQALEGNNIVQISAGWGHSACVTSDKEVIIFGRTQDIKQIIGAGNWITYGNEFARKFSYLFKKTIVDTLYPTRLPLEQDHARQVSASAALTACCTEEGHVYTYGYNKYGQCGVDSNKFNFFDAQRVPLRNEDHIIQVSCGFQHVAALSDKGKVFTWGKAERGQLGVTPREMIPKPVWVETMDGIHVQKVFTGFNSTFMLDDHNDLYVCGKYWSPAINEKKDTIYADQGIPRKLDLPTSPVTLGVGQFHLSYQDSHGDLFLLGMEDGLTSKLKSINEEEERDNFDRMHHIPVQVDTTSIQNILFKKIVCSGTDCYGITNDGYVYQWNWLHVPEHVTLYDDLFVEDLSFGWKHTMVLGTERNK